MTYEDWSDKVTVADVQIRMDALPDEAVSLAEDVWTEDEPTVAEYELMRDVLSSDWMRNDRGARRREAEQRTALGLQTWIQRAEGAARAETGLYHQGRADALQDALEDLLRVCVFCAYAGRSCIPLWPQQRKCCPDCTHGRHLKVGPAFYASE